MNMKVEFHPKNQVAIVTIDDVISVIDLYQLIPKIAQCTQENICDRVIVDLRNASHDFSLVDIFYLPRILTEIGVPDITKIGIVYPESDNVDRYNDAFELNQITRVKSFKTLESASNWLDSIDRRKNDFDNALIELTKSSTEEIGVTVCMICLYSNENLTFEIKTASPIDRQEPLELALSPNLSFNAYRYDRENDSGEKCEVVRSRDFLDHLKNGLGLSSGLESALQVPLIVDNRVRGYFVGGEVRNWDSAPITRNKIGRATQIAGDLESCLESEYYRGAWMQ